MPPITNLDQITGIDAIIKWLHRGNQPNPFNILLLGDGFTEDEFDTFKEFIDKLKDRFFRISPFRYCKPYINILYWFGASKTSGIGPPLPWESEPPADDLKTVLRTYIVADDDPIKTGIDGSKTEGQRTFRSPEGGFDGLPSSEEKLRLRIINGNEKGAYEIAVISDTELLIKKDAAFKWKDTEGNLSFDIVGLYNLKTWDEQRVVEVVEKLQLPEDLELPAWIPRTAAGVWLNPLRCKSFGAVGTVANTTGGIPVSIPVSLDGRDWHYVLFNMRGFKPEPGRLAGGFEHVFAHELAHSFRITDEYETTRGVPPTEKAEAIDKSYDNVQVMSATQNSAPEEFLDQLKWKPLMSKKDRDGIRDRSHIFLRSRMSEFGLIDDLDDIDDDPYENETIPGLGRKVHWSDIFLIEGGAEFTRSVYRSNFECKMRHGIFDEDSTDEPEKYKVVVNGQETYGSPEFCRVCNYQIRHHITGYTEFGIGGIDRNKLQLVFDNEVMPRLNKSFRIQNARTGSSLSTAYAFCDIASIRAYMMFRTMPSALDMKLNIKELHVCLYFRGVLLDPTFYDMYRLAVGNEEPVSTDPMSDSDLHFVTATGEVRPFKNWEVARGFVGTQGEICAYYFRRRLRAGTYGNPMYTDYTDETPKLIVDYIYGDEQTKARLKIPWVGPAEDYEQNKVNPAEFGLIGRDYFAVFKNEWDRWQQYLAGPPSDGSLDYLRPLDMRLSLQHVLSLPEEV